MGEGDELGAGRQSKLIEDVGGVGRHGAWGNGEHVRDLSIGATRGNELEDLVLAGAQSGAR